MSYHRMFFVLKEDTPGYGDASSRAPQGRCVIEARGGAGKVLVYVQDLKPQAAYKATLVKRGDDRSIGVILGPIEVNPSRRADARFDINPTDVNGSGFAIQDFDTMAITHDTGRLVIVLSGSSGACGRWRSNLDVSSRVQERGVESASLGSGEKAGLDGQQIPFIRLASYDELPGFDNKAPGGDCETEEATREEKPHIAFIETVERLNKELNELAEITSAAVDENDAGKTVDKVPEEAPEKTPEEVPEEVPVPEKTPEEVPVPEEVQDEAPGETPESDVSAAAVTESLEWKKDWKKITLRELNLLPIDCFDYEQKAIIAASFYKHGNLVLSNAPQETGAMYILGVPGTLTPEESEGYKRLGFYDFKGNEALEEGARGYWLKKL